MNNYKEVIKCKIKGHAFSELKKMQAPHSKVNTISYNTFKAQSYITDHILNNEEVALLFSLRSRTVRNIKSNFSSMHNMQLKCQLGCNTDETQEHILDCNFLTQNKSRDQHINYLHIYGYPEQQIKVTQVFSLLLEEREELIIKRGASSLPVGPRCFNTYIVMSLWKKYI